MLIRFCNIDHFSEKYGGYSTGKANPPLVYLRVLRLVDLVSFGGYG